LSATTPEGRVKLELFEGPLDLLLYLIRKEEIDIHDIPIVEVTAQYQALLESLRRSGLLDLDFAGDYFLLAATLIQIKTRMLLPRPDGGDVDEPIEDPRLDLVRQLLEYERYREAAMELRERAEVAGTMMGRPDAAVQHLYGGDAGLDVDLLALARAFRKVLDDKRLRTPHVFRPSRFTVRDRIRTVLEALAAPREAGRPCLFTELFEEGTIEEAVVTFLAILELVKRGFLRCRQAHLLDDIELELVPEADRPAIDVLAPSEFDEKAARPEDAESFEVSDPGMGDDEDDVPGDRLDPDEE
jgi:segregation and condensation protein A